jgi:DNA-directed RNA polymerase specialized sigma24 family protein
VVNRSHRPERRTDLIKSQRPCSRDVVELVDETSRPGSPAAANDLPPVGTFEDFYRRELPRRAGQPGRLPKRQAQVTALFHALDRSVIEVATTIGCAEGTVKLHLSRAVHSLSWHPG